MSKKTDTTNLLHIIRDCVFDALELVQADAIQRHTQPIAERNLTNALRHLDRLIDETEQSTTKEGRTR